MSDCACLEQSRGDLHWGEGFQELGGFDQACGDFRFRVTRVRCLKCGRGYEIMADDTPAYRVIYSWSANAAE